MVKWINPGNRVAPPTPRCSSNWKGSLRVPLTKVTNFTGRNCWRFTSFKCPWERHEQTVVPQQWVIVEQTEFLSPWFSNQSWRRKTLNLNLLYPASKLTLCHILFMGEGLGKYIFRLIKLCLDRWVECLSMVRETGVQSQFESYQKLKKMVLDAALLNTQHYKVRIKGKVEQSRESRVYEQRHLPKPTDVSP